MDWKDLAGAVGRSAPLLGTLIGGAPGAAIGGLVAAALGTAATPDAVQTALATDPEAAVKLRQIESDERVALQRMTMDHANALLAADTAAQQAELEDRRSARDRDVEFLKHAQRNVRADVMVAGATLGLVACLLCLVLYRDKIPAEAVGIISTVASIFGLCLRDAFNFEFGSSRGSATKTELLARSGPIG